MRRLAEILRRLDSPETDFATRLEALEEELGETVYSEIIYLLAHLRFDAVTARVHWGRILDRQREMKAALGGNVDLRVALISYFVEVSRQLESPTVIEMRLLRQTEALAYQDELTGLCNYRYFREFLRRELPRSDRYGDPASVVLIDVDDFKSFNDTHGHERGNQALARLGKLFASSVRSSDLAARYGGEEFVVVMPSTPKAGAARLGEELRRRVATAFGGDDADHEDGSLTVSLGVATYPADGADGDQLIRNADRALYVAKSQGKNQVQLYESSRRSFRRVRLELRGWYLAPRGPEHELRTLDASANGLRFMSATEIPIGSLVDLRLNAPGADRSLEVVARAVYSQARDDGWEAAVQILAMDAADRRLLAQLLQADS